MKVSHILYKTGNLEEAVAKFRELGFKVEYGRRKRPVNALIYFSEGPYLELLGNMRFPAIVNWLLSLFGKKYFADRIKTWGKAKEGLTGLCIETANKDFKTEKEALRKEGQKYFAINSRRNDTKGRKLRFKVLFPANMKIPFMMTRFNINPKPINYTHPNGISKITHVGFGSDKALIPFIRSLCDDPALDLFEGEGIRDLRFDNGETIDQLLSKNKRAQHS